MLVVISLQLVEVPSFVICRINVVQHVVADVINHIAYLEEAPEEGLINGVLDHYHKSHSHIAQVEDEGIEREGQY